MRVSDQTIDRIYVNTAVRAKNYKTVANHFHYYYELFYVRHGQCRFFISNALYELRAGDFLIIPPHTVHLNRYLSAGTRINIYFRKSDLSHQGEIADRVREKFFHLVHVHIPTAYRDTFHSLLDRMLQEDKVDDENTKYMLELMLEQFLIMTSRHCFISEGSTASTGSRQDQKILEAARYISDHFSEPLTLSDLSARTGLSPNYFSKKFKSVTGTGMKEYVSAIRLEHAARELVSTSHSVIDVAMNCGFSDGNYFKDAFRKAYGISPRAYRNSVKTDLIHNDTLRPDRENDG